jgi:predicted transcriptional regulator
MAAPEGIKQEARRLVDQLPEGASWDDLMYKIYVRQAIEQGLADADAGRLIPHDDVVRRLRERGR